ncbi:MAG TPA: hypothetical protein VIY86_15405, partial [Pirellulaceae bacterium]
AMSFLPSGDRIVTGGEDRAICVWDVSTGEELTHLGGSTGRILAVQMLDDRRLAAGTSRNRIDIWNLDSGVCEHSLSGHTGSVAVLVRHAGYLVSGGYDATVRLWNLSGAYTSVAARTSRTEERR